MAVFHHADGRRGVLTGNPRREPERATMLSIFYEAQALGWDAIGAELERQHKTFDKLDNRAFS